MTQTTGETIYGVWELVELNGEPPIRQPTVVFTLQPEFLPSGEVGRPAHYQFQGNDGCNSFSGAYSISGDRLATTPGNTTLIGCPAGEVSDQANKFTSVLYDKFTSVLYEGTQWAIGRGQLILTGDAGTVAKLREVTTNAAIGVWNLTDFDGQPTEGNVTLTFFTRSRFSGYVGCWISGDYEITGNQLTVSALPPDVGAEDREFVSPQFLCETLNETEQQFLELIEAGQGVIQSDQLTITNEAGATASFQRQ